VVSLRNEHSVCELTDMWFHLGMNTVFVFVFVFGNKVLGRIFRSEKNNVKLKMRKLIKRALKFVPIT
jgi:hypothetical protein